MKEKLEKKVSWRKFELLSQVFFFHECKQEQHYE